MDRNGDFHPISLHRLIEHLLLDIKNIKMSLYWLTKYILNKYIERGKVNDFDNLKGVGNMAWDFILAIYKSGWDALSADNNNISFRNKVVAKFTPKINNYNMPKNSGSKSDNKPATMIRLPPHIPAKLSKEVKDIAKIFKKNKKNKRKRNL